MNTKTEKMPVGKVGSRNPPTGGKRTGEYPKTQQTFFFQYKFIGGCDGLKWHIFDLNYSIQVNQVNTTLWEIARYVGQNYRYGGGINLTLELQDLHTINITDKIYE